MGISHKLLSSFTLLLIMLSVCVGASPEKTELNSSRFFSTFSGNNQLLLAEENKLQGLKNSSMADGLDDENGEMSMQWTILRKLLQCSESFRMYFCTESFNTILLNQSALNHSKAMYRRRRRLANCGIGFGRNAIGGRDGRYYVVSDPGDDNPVNPKPGTLRHAVIQDRPLWIVFKRDMVITLKQELIMNSFKTIDARGVNVHIAYGACITIQFVTNIIIHGLHIHDCKPTGNDMVRSTPSHYGWRTMADGDGISIFGASPQFTVMLLGHSDSYVRDKQMQVTIAYNHFGEGLISACRVNNDYTHWEMYAIGGSASPTINSQGNRFLAPNNPFAKEVTKREGGWNGEWKRWNWRSEGDLLLNGAYFTPSGAAAATSYARASSLGAKSSSLVGMITSSGGALACRNGRMC
ncbi:putative pectate lyase 15 [Hibiscus syriacus]|uniref:Pectate lyase n=1 Tax=Hibiscus syriacus TaxID=106335 RepID=A0A6A2ZJP0_HIBSY|nr:putative pectate lyase 15 [Hibiscus syriacus]